VTTTDYTRTMLARRPGAPGVPAFGHVDVAADGRLRLHEITKELFRFVTFKKEEVPFHPDDLAEDGEVLVAPLKGFDKWFQTNAAWSLERAVREIRATGTPEILTTQGIVQGGWSFYVIRSMISGKDTVLIRAKSPSWGLNSEWKLLTKFVGNELKLVKEPLIAFDQTADLVVVAGKVYVLNPRRVEGLLIDAKAVKDRAEETVKSFDQKLQASLTRPTVIAVERLCSHNANVARRVERLIRDGDLANVTAAKVRAALPDAGLKTNAFGSSGALRALTDTDAAVLVDIAADLYYQPRFSAAPRRVAAYRRVV
jgi:hypothetical protein